MKTRDTNFMKKNNTQGFTLLELMIVIGIVAIVSTIAVGYFGKNVIAANRVDGRTALLNTAATLEKCKSIYGAYNNNNCSISDGDDLDSPDGLYTVSVDSASTTFTLTASPASGSAQSGDDDCTSLILDHLGRQTGTGADSSVCW